MKEEAARAAARLVRRCRVAALGTLHEGVPAVSQVPFAVLPAADCALAPRTVRVVAGFAQAASITPAALAQAIRETDEAA